MSHSLPQVPYPSGPAAQHLSLMAVVCAKASAAALVLQPMLFPSVSVAPPAGRREHTDMQTSLLGY